jgi:RND family efflux transporter MFP subunit
MVILLSCELFGKPAGAGAMNQSWLIWIGLGDVHMVTNACTSTSTTSGARPRAWRWGVVALIFLSTGWAWLPRQALAGEALQAFTVASSARSSGYTTDAMIEAVRDAKVASQVPGRIVELSVKAGDHVQAGQVLARIDASVVNQQLAGSQAQLAQAQAQATVARTELVRARLLFKKEYLSQGALDQAEAQARAADAQVRALQAQVGSVAAQAAWHVVRAPFGGWVAQVAVSQGDAALPGQPLMTVYDPAAMRVSAQVPERVGAQLSGAAQAVRALEVDGRALTPANTPELAKVAVQVLPAVDPVSRTVTVRVPLPPSIKGLRPGQAVKLVLPIDGAVQDAAAAGGTFWVPLQALVRRGELDAVYVIDRQGQPRLRQVRVGRVNVSQAEVMAGLGAGERIAMDPVAAVRAAAR